MLPRVFRSLSFLGLILVGTASGQEGKALVRVQTIDLSGPVGRRLDHMALDRKHQRLFVANMANASLDIVDLRAGKRLQSVPNQHGIQGIAYDSERDRLFVGLGEDGVCNIFSGSDYRLQKSIPLADADNVRFDVRQNQIIVGHAEPALAVIDPQMLSIKAQIRLPGQPEAFQVERRRPRLYVNVPSTRSVIGVDTETRRIVATYPLKVADQNFPLALDEPGRRLFIGCRKPPRIAVMDTDSGRELAVAAIAADTDDVFYDAKRQRIYASCGEGFVSVLQEKMPNHFETVDRVPTVRLARTSLFDPDASRLYLAVPRQSGQPGPQIWVYQARP